jgi:hypothetical protein
MVSLAGLSRRSLVAATAAFALGPTAMDQKPEKPNPAPKPLAFVAVAVTGVFFNLTFDAFAWTFQSSLYHPASDFAQDASGQTTSDADTVREQARAQLIAQARSAAASILSQAGHPVPEDRIALTLI